MKPHKIFFLLIFPFVLIWAICARILDEVKGIPRYVWCDICQEWDTFKRIMRDE